MKSCLELDKLSNYCQTSAGGTPLKSNKAFYDGGTIPWLLSGEIGTKDITRAKNKITEYAIENSSAKIYPENSVLIAMYGATAGEVGILRFPSASNQAVCAIYPSETFTPEYLYYFFLSFKDKLIAQAVGNAQPNISQAKIKNTLIPVIGLTEQKEIVAILDQAFAAIDQAQANIQQNIQNAQDLFQSKLNQIFSQQGKGWKEKKLNDLCKIKHGFAFKSKYFVPDGEYVVLTPGSFHEKGGFRDQGGKTKYYKGDIPDGYILEKDSFLFAMTEQAKGLLGSSLIVPKEDYYLHNQRLGLVEIIGDTVWHNDFFFHQFNTDKFRNSVQLTASGVKVRHTSPTKLGDINIAFPRTLDEQQTIAENLNGLLLKTEEIVFQYKNKITELEELKKSLLQKAFTGELTNNEQAA